MDTISLITVYNNEELLNQMRESAQKQENVNIEYVFIDNRNNEFSSAAAALNYGFKKANGRVLVFLHQDIEFMDSGVLKSIFDYAINNPDTIFGAAGVDGTRSGIVLSTINGLDTISSPVEALTLDECLIACHKNVFDKIEFDEVLCDGWHLYGADLCLQAKLIHGLKVEAFPMNVWHKSPGCADKNYYKTQNKLGAKYRKHIKVITTTNSWVYTNPIKSVAHSIYRRLRYRGEVR